MSSTKLAASAVALAFATLPSFSQAADPPKNDPALTVPLTVDAGVPLRVYLTKRLTKRLGETVHARLAEPVFAFDREVIPANAEVLGQVVKLDAASKMRRFTAIAGGDFTPLHDASVEFTTVVLPDGRKIPLHTAASLGLNSIYSPWAAAHAKNNGAASTSKTGKVAQAKQQAKDQIHAKIASVTEMVRAPGKIERVEDYLVAKLPYHPQWIRRGTRYDAELLSPLDFGRAKTTPGNLSLLGTQPPPDSIVHVRLITPLSSSDADKGDKVEAVVSQPLFSADHKLILPVGTRLDGAVTVARAARWFHRGGRLRFSFREVQLPEAVRTGGLMSRAQEPAAPLQTIATLNAVEPASKASVKVDEEGTAKASEPKTRFIAPAIAALIATRSADNDAGRHRMEGTGTGNTGGRTLAGASGFGLFGMIAAQESPTFAGVMGFYGMGWSVFNNVIARGSEVDFGKNAAMDIKFGARPVIPASKFTSANTRRGTGRGL